METNTLRTTEKKRVKKKSRGKQNVKDLAIPTPFSSENPSFLVHANQNNLDEIPYPSRDKTAAAERLPRARKRSLVFPILLTLAVVTIIAGVVVLVQAVTGEDENGSSDLVSNFTGAFDIEIRVVGPAPPEAVTSALSAAAARWSEVIVGNLGDIKLKNSIKCGLGTMERGEVIDDLVIFASFTEFDGEGGVLGAASFCQSDRNKIPRTGQMQFDIDDVNSLLEKGSLYSVILHEMGHVIGIGSLWKEDLIKESENKIEYIGENGVQGLSRINGKGNPLVEAGGNVGTTGVHWEESSYRDELMTGFLTGVEQPLSALTVSSLVDLGYQVNLAAVDDFEVPAARGHQPGDVPYGDDILHTAHTILTNDGYELKTEGANIIGVGAISAGVLVCLTVAIGLWYQRRL